MKTLIFVKDFIITFVKFSVFLIVVFWGLAWVYNTQITSKVSLIEVKADTVIIPQDVLDKIKARHAAKWPDDYRTQKLMLDADVKAYLAING